METPLLIQTFAAGWWPMGASLVDFKPEHCLGIGVISSSPRRMVDWATRSIGERGLLMTLSVAISAVADLFFDLRHGTDTARVVGINELDVRSENIAHAVHYQATKAAPLTKLLRRLRLPEKSVFVDYGAGKGRVLLLAAKLPFKRVVGVEFSAKLCAIAERNVELFRRKYPVMVPVEIVTADAAQFELRHDENVFYFYNPFDAALLDQVMRKIGESLNAHPRPAWIIYGAPCHARVIDEVGIFARCETFVYGGAEFRVYANAAAVESQRERI
jgi:SAM-dependent methyltransferase